MSRFPDALRAELAKIRTVRGLVVGAVVSVLAVPLTSLLVVTTGGLGEHDTLTSGAATGTVVGLLASGAWGAAVGSSEYLHRTISVSLAAVPHRATLFGAKVAAAAAVATGGGIVSALLSLLLVRTATPPHSHSAGTPAALAALVAALVAVTAVGVALGVLVRSSTASISLLAAAVLLPKAAAGLLGGLQPWVVGVSPGTVVTQVVGGAQLAEDQRFPGGTGMALLVMLVVAGAVAVGSAVAFEGRDG